MVNKYIKNAVTSFIVGVFCAVSVMVAVAASAESPEQSFSAYGYQYDNQASVYTFGDGAKAYTDIFSYGDVPSGYMGAKARLYESDGTLQEYSDYKYNGSSSGGIGASTSLYEVSGGAFYSYGLTKVYNGDGYYTVGTYKSPTINN